MIVKEIVTTAQHAIVALSFPKTLASNAHLDVKNAKMVQLALYVKMVFI
jgi:hypothetical protein